MYALAVLVSLLALVGIVSPSSLTSGSGSTAIIPGWYLHSTSKTSDLDLVATSRVGVNVSDWYRVSARGTVFAGLLENGIYKEADLFYSDNLEKLVD